MSYRCLKYDKIISIDKIIKYFKSNRKDKKDICIVNFFRICSFIDRWFCIEDMRILTKVLMGLHQDVAIILLYYFEILIRFAFKQNIYSSNSYILPNSAEDIFYFIRQ